MCTIFRLLAILVGIKIVQYGHIQHSMENILWGLTVILFGGLTLMRSVWRYRS